jgi:hypothetical protein
VVSSALSPSVWRHIHLLWSTGTMPPIIGPAHRRLCDGSDLRFPCNVWWFQRLDVTAARCPWQLLPQVTALTHLTHLQVISAGEQDDITAFHNGISKCIALQSLCLSNCERLASIDALSGCVALETLDLGYCKQLVNVDALSGCVAMQSLDLRYCERLASIDALSGCVALNA